MSLAALEKNQNIHQYNLLPESEPEAIISQSEHTIIIKDKTIIITKIN